MTTPIVLDSQAMSLLRITLRNILQHPGSALRLLAIALQEIGEASTASLKVLRGIFEDMQDMAPVTHTPVAWVCNLEAAAKRTDRLRIAASEASSIRKSLPLHGTLQG